MHDEDIPASPTLAQVQEYTDGVFCWCNRCHHNAVLPLAVLIGHCGPVLPFPIGARSPEVEVVPENRTGR
jgi:hypothetical protein